MSVSFSHEVKIKNREQACAPMGERHQIAFTSSVTVGQSACTWQGNSTTRGFVFSARQLPRWHRGREVGSRWGISRRASRTRETGFGTASASQERLVQPPKPLTRQTSPLPPRPTRLTPPFALPPTLWRTASARDGTRVEHDASSRNATVRVTHVGAIYDRAGRRGIEVTAASPIRMLPPELAN